mgnify:CR=1 FL=1
MNKTVNEQTTNLDDFVSEYITKNLELIPEYKLKLIEVDKYTDGLGSYIVKLVHEFWEEYHSQKYHNFFGNDWLIHWKMDYDPKDIVYVEENDSVDALSSIILSIVLIKEVYVFTFIFVPFSRNWFIKL